MPIYTVQSRKMEYENIENRVHALRASLYSLQPS